jgi:RHS repeat-associated protein
MGFAYNVGGSLCKGKNFEEQISTTQPHGFTSPYRFNGKELGQESGLYYYGARYYNPTMSVWLVVDPLAHKFPHQSPYVFTDNNPIMFVDPDGRQAICETCPDSPLYDEFKNSDVEYVYNQGSENENGVGTVSEIGATLGDPIIAPKGSFNKKNGTRNTQKGGNPVNGEYNIEHIKLPRGLNPGDPIDNPEMGGGPGKWGANMGKNIAELMNKFRKLLGIELPKSERGIETPEISKVEQTEKVPTHVDIKNDTIVIKWNPRNRNKTRTGEEFKVSKDSAAKWTQLDDNVKYKK